jgi:flagellar basal body-associated protein FliL
MPPVQNAPTSGFPTSPGYGPGFPGGPGFPPPPGGPTAAYPGQPAPSRGRRGPLIVVLVLAGVLLLCGGGGLTAFLLLRNSGGEGQPSPSAATVSFLTAVYKDKDATKASRYVCGAARDAGKIENKVNEVRRYVQRFDRDPKFTWDEPKVESGGKKTAKLSVTVKFSTNDDRVAEEKLSITAINDSGWFVCDVQTVG